MTTTDDNNATTAGRRKTTPIPEGGYEWTCPYCGQSRTNSSNGEDGETNAIKALRTHIVASDGDDHGPRNELPTDDLTLSDHVERVDERRRGSGSRDT
jgi:hypothetical protein